MYITDLSEEDIEIAIKVTMTMVVRRDMMIKTVKDNCQIYNRPMSNTKVLLQKCVNCNNNMFNTETRFQKFEDQMMVVTGIHHRIDRQKTVLFICFSFLFRYQDVRFLSSETKLRYANFLHKIINRCVFHNRHGRINIVYIFYQIFCVKHISICINFNGN